MCGIAGILNLRQEAIPTRLMESMTQSLRHRGPDGSGIVAEGPIGFGHRRLAIIDPTPASDQPMTSGDGRYLMVYNGEIYNFASLRSELEALGRRFKSKGDSEVLLNAFAEFGIGALPKLNGMFAFAIWDRHEKELWLARDRYGVKPLYYSFIGGDLVFASEAKAIIRHPAYAREMDLEGLLEYFTFQNFFTDRTLFKGIRMLPAGCYMRIPCGAARAEPARYWDFCFQEPASPASEAEYCEEIERLVRQAVSRQLVSDAPVGAYLSSGLDSGAVTGLAARELPYLKSFTCGFDLHSASGLEITFDERKGAELLSYLFKTEHYEMVLKAGDMERVLPSLCWHLEEPRVGQSYPNYYIAQLASKFVKVALSGTGGDELFGGYPWRYYRAAVNTGFEDYIDKYYAYWQRLVPNRTIHKLFAPVWDRVKHVWTRDIFRAVFANHASELARPEDYINHSLYFEAKTFLHGLLVMEDKLSMAHGLETRVPFLDNDLVDLVMRVPVGMKLSNLGDITRVNENQAGKKALHYTRTNEGKSIFRKSMRKLLPPELIEAEKQGFSAPDASWFKGESVEYVKRLLLSRNARIYSYLDYDTSAALLNEHLSGENNRRLLIWSLLSVENWIDRFLA